MPKAHLNDGDVIDGFLLRQRLHAGGMAELWRVTREGLDTPALMKVPFLREGDDATAIVGFEMECMILPTLSGPHVPRCIAVGDFAVQPYLVMEHVTGVALIDRFDKAPLPIDDVVSIGLRVATALHDLHRQHVIHLDVKPSNIITRGTGEACLIDFGLSRHDQLPDLLAEEFRLPMGTGPYIAPEQILRVRSDPRSDLFALGVMLYALATGQRPFGKPQRMPALKRRFWRDPVPPRRLRQDLPAWLQEIILRCLEVDPDARHPTAAQLAFDLAHPDMVKLTARAERRDRDGVLTVAKRWLKAIGLEPQARPPVASHMAAAPIVVAAVDLSPGVERLAEALRTMVGRMLATMPDARLACVNVLKQSLIAIDPTVDADGNNIHLQRLIELRHWAEPLGLAAERMTFHVLEATDPAAALIDYARANGVDQIVIGARASGPMRRYLGSVSSQVVAEAPCTVTVVRLPQRLEDGTGSGDGVLAEK